MPVCKMRWILLCCIANLCLVFGLYEDQIGNFDWRQQYVGKVDHLYWDQSHTGKRLLVVTEKNVIASIHSLNGSLAWRQLMEDGERGQIDAAIHHGASLVTVCGGGRYVRSWNTGSGTLAWEAVTTLNGGERSAVAFARKSKDTVVVATTEGAFLYAASNGQSKVTIPLPSSGNTLYGHLIVKDDDITIIGVTPGEHVTVIKADSEGLVKSQHSIPAPWISKHTSCEIVKNKDLLCYDPSTQALQLLDVVDGRVFMPTNLQDLGVTVDGPVVIEKIQTIPVADTDTDVQIRVSSNHVIIVKPTSKGIQIVKNLPKVSAAQLTEFEDNAVLLTMERTTQETVVLRGYDLATGGELAELNQKIHFPAGHGLPLKFNALLFRRKGKIVCRIAVLSEDYSIQMIHQSGKVAWKREEAMAYIISVEMVDLPVSENQAKFEDEFGSNEDDILAMFVKRFTTQISQLKTWIAHLLQKLQGHRHHQGRVVAEEDEEEEEEEEEELTRDEFNLNKIVVAVTTAGKIFGFRSVNSHIVWQAFLPELSPFNRFNKETMLLFVQRTTAHFPHLPQCVVLGKHKKTGHGLLYAFNPISGEPLSGMPPGGQHLNYEVLQATGLGVMDEHFLKGLVLLDNNYKVHTFPADYRTVILETNPSVLLFVTDIDTGLLMGYRVTRQSNQELHGEHVWTVNLQRKQQTITNVVGKSINEHVHSQGRVLGDRSVLYKYINPNLVVVTAEGEESNPSAQKGPSNFVNVYLIDAVTGHMVFHTSHKRAKGPVHIVHSENWVLYSYFNQRTRRTEMAILEMYEPGKEQSNSTAFSSFTAPQQPLVLRQAYIFPLSLSTMATSVTDKGITNKVIIIALNLGGLLSLPKAFLDPRRPVMPTSEHMEEGTVPYIPELPENKEAYINYNQSVFGIRAIHSSPAGLESTSLVLAYGIDLFFTRVTPSKMFDVLKEDFDYFFITAVLGAMVLVSIISQKLAVRKALNRAWK